MEFEVPEMQEKWSFIINAEIKDPDVVLKMPYPQFLQCFRTVSFQKVVKLADKYNINDNSFRTVSFQKVVKPKVA